MIFQSKKSYESAGPAQVFGQLWNAIRNQVEVSRMVNSYPATAILRSRIVDLDNGNPVARSIKLSDFKDAEQFGVTEQEFAFAGKGIVRRTNIVRVKMEDNLRVAPEVGQQVFVSDIEDGAGVNQPVVGGSPRVGTITEITDFHAVNNPYVFVLLRRCTAVVIVP